MDISLQSGRFWATSVALFRESFLDFWFCWIVWIYIVWGHSRGLSLRSFWHVVPLTFAHCVMFSEFQCHHVGYVLGIQCESKKIPPPEGPDILFIFYKRLRIFNRFLRTYYTFLYTLDHKFLFNYLQLWRSFAILSATTCSHNMLKMPTIGRNACIQTSP